MTIKQATLSDLDAILKLQEKYHVSNLTEAEKQEKGFVTMKVTPEQFTQLIENQGVFIAGNDLVNVCAVIQKHADNLGTSFPRRHDEVASLLRAAFRAHRRGRSGVVEAGGSRGRSG